MSAVKVGVVTIHVHIKFIWILLDRVLSNVGVSCGCFEAILKGKYRFLVYLQTQKVVS